MFEPLSTLSTEQKYFGFPAFWPIFGLHASYYVDFVLKLAW
jgi:hypothetical protein